MADEDSTEQTPSLQSEPELEDEPPVPKTRREKLGAFLQSNPVQYGILALVVIDVIIVILEILIDFNMITIPENDHSSDAINASYHHNVSTHFEMDDLTTPLYHHDPHALRSVPHEPHNEVHHNVTSHHHFSTNHSDHFNSSDHHLTHHEGAHHHSNKETVEHVLHYSSLTILAIFVVEVFCKLIAEGLHFFKHKAEVFDALVVLVSFSLDIAFSFISVTSAARDATGLMVLLRLWRVTRIVNGVIMSVKKDADKKIAEQKHGRLKAEAEVDRLRSKVESLQKELDNVKRKLKKQTSNPNGRTSTPVVISVDEPVCSNNIGRLHSRLPSSF